MSRTAAKVTQADVARAIRAAKQTGAGYVEILPDGSIRISLSPPLSAKYFFACLPHPLRVLESVCVFLGVNGIVAATIIVPPDLLFVPLAVGLVAVCGVSLLLKRKG